MEHKTHEQILEEIRQAKMKLDIGADYAHYKDPKKTYRVKEFGTLEADNELCVIYQAQYGPGLIFIRPLSEWLAKVEWEGNIVPRFVKHSLLIAVKN